jgi:hypothetical protein
MADVAGGFLGCHAGHGTAYGDALFERGQDAQSHFGGEGGLTEKYCGKGGFGIKPMIGQKAQRF